MVKRRNLSNKVAIKPLVVQPTIVNDRTQVSNSSIRQYIRGGKTICLHGKNKYYCRECGSKYYC